MTATKTYPIWMLRLVPGGRWGRWFAAAIILLVGLAIYAPAVSMVAENPVRWRNYFAWAPALFFVCAVAYIVPTFHYITGRTHRALDQLAPYFRSRDALAAAHASIDQRSVFWFVRVALFSIALWLIQSRLLAGSWHYMWQRAGEGYVAIVMDFGSLPVWLTMNTAMSALVQNALTFRGLMPKLATNIFEPKSFMPIGRMAVTSTLVVVGAMASLSIMWIDGPTNLWTTLPGLLIFAPLLVLLLLLPVWPLHRELLRQRMEAVAAAQAQVQAHCTATEEEGGQLAQALSLRREVSRLPVWPFDVGAVTRFVSYAVIVPLTWAGAALIEMLVNTLLE
ncbi:MAG: hypothetical protein AAFY69_01685 [Pseudomonadota bacterium]